MAGQGLPWDNCGASHVDPVDFNGPGRIGGVICAARSRPPAARSSPHAVTLLLCPDDGSGEIRPEIGLKRRADPQKGDLSAPK